MTITSVFLKLYLMYSLMDTRDKANSILNYLRLMEVCWFRYLAVVTALASEADFVFIPEAPPSVDWKDKLCDKLEQASVMNVLQYQPLT